MYHANDLMVISISYVFFQCLKLILSQFFHSINEEIFDKMKTNGCYYVTVIEDLETNQIAGSATLFTEYKFIHGGGLVIIIYIFFLIKF